MAQKSVLGKGLASLISSSAANAGPEAAEKPVAPEASNRDRHMGISMASVEDIHPNPSQPRREFDDASLLELSQSILSSGIIQPLVVRKTPKDGFELIAGERRLRAAKLAGLKQVPIVIRRSTDRESLELALIENIQRRDLNCVDEALAYFQLVEDYSLTQESIAERVGKDRATVANYLRLLKLPPEILEDLKNQLLTFGHAKALLGLDDNEVRLRVRKQVLEKKLSVRETEAWVDQIKRARVEAGGAPDVKPSDSIAKRLTQMARDLGKLWATKVEVKGSETRGKIVIHYSNRQEFDRILIGIEKGPPEKVEAKVQRPLAEGISPSL